MRSLVGFSVEFYEVTVSVALTLNLPGLHSQPEDSGLILHGNRKKIVLQRLQVSLDDIFLSI